MTGGSGLLGKKISKSLSLNGATVIVIDKKVAKFSKDIDFYLCDLQSIHKIKETKEKNFKEIQKN